MRQALWLAFSGLLVLVVGALLAASLAGTSQLAGQLAEPLMASISRENEAQMHRLFAPLRQKIIEDHTSIQLGRFTATDPVALKDRFLPDLNSLPHVDSMMVGDLTGSQFLVMRYSEAAYRSALFAPVAAQLPPPTGDPTRLQFFTRDFRPATTGKNSRWILWDNAGQTIVHRWELPLPDFDGRQRPWHRAAMAQFSDYTPGEAHARGEDLVAWTEIYPLFTTKAPGISASVAARDPQGKVLIVAYDLLLDEIARFSSAARPTPNGQVFVLTEDHRLLGPPHDPRPEAATRRASALLQPADAGSYPAIATAFAVWQRNHAGRPARFRVTLAGETCWAGFSPFTIGRNRMLWIGVLLPEADLVPAAAAQQRRIVAVGGLALLLAGLLAAFLSRRLSAPLITLAAQARRLAALDLTPAPLVPTRVAELVQFSHTLNETRLALHRHIVAREQARLELAERELQLRTLAENTPEIIVRLDRDYRHLYLNPAHSIATGLPAAAVLGRRLREVAYPTELIPVWEQTLAAVFADQRPQTIEFDYPTLAGRRHFEARLIPEPAPDRGVATVLALFHDVTERVQAAEALRRSEARHRSLIESALVGIVVHQDGIVRYANPALIQLFGYESDRDIIGRLRWEDCIAPAHHDELRARATAALGGEPPPMHTGWQLVRRDGTRRWVQSSVTAIEWDGTPALLSFIRDITELHEATERQAALKEQLREAQKLEAVGLLAGGIAHDFNNLLQIIGGNATLADDTSLPLSERSAALAEIEKTVHRAAEMTRQLLAFSRRQALDRVETELNALVAEHVKMVRRLIPENILIDLLPAPQPIVVLADRSQLEQVFLNLCVNARDAMPQGGRLTLQLEAVDLDADTAARIGLPRGGPCARITVSDTGLGMDQATAARIFEPFFSTKAQGKGTGLGLAVVYGIMRQHEGHIAVSSQPGTGTSFVLHLPYQPDHVVPAAPPEEPVEKGGGGGTILLAEDNEPIRRLAAQTLRHAGYTVLCVENGQEAVDRFTRDHAQIDLLFLDVMMPVLGGFEAARQCRLLKPEIPVVFASGYAAGSVNDGESIPAGALMLQKPYRTDRMLRLIQRLLPKRRA
jgi:PAS domain S-box-containing protein